MARPRERGTRGAIDGASDFGGCSQNACASSAAGPNDAVGRDDALGTSSLRLGGRLLVPRARSSSDAGTTGVARELKDPASSGGKSESEFERSSAARRE
jgi:hypothetical protein